MLISHKTSKKLTSLTLEQLLAMNFDECHGGLVLLYKPLAFNIVVTNNYVIVIVTIKILVQNHMIFVYAFDNHRRNKNNGKVFLTLGQSRYLS